MADSSIGALPQVQDLYDDSLLVVEQQGRAMKASGAQFKEFGRQAVIGQVQSYVDQAQAAAESAVDAVSAVTGMTVSAHASDTPTVSKSTQAGRVNLEFGLPRGEPGKAGPEGQQGPRGPQGAPGTGLTILGHYDIEEALRAAVLSPNVGDAYGVGMEAPYDIYVFDGVSLDWKNYGQLGGGTGGVIPENVVTVPGGAVIEAPGDDGETHTLTITFDEEPPLTAEDVKYGEKTVKDALDGLFTSVSDGKARIASAVTDKGVDTAPDASFSQMAENIGQIKTGADTQDATATPGDILYPKTAYTASGKVEGVIPSLPAQTITPGTADKAIANGQYLSGTQTIKGDPNLTSANIKKGVSLFGVVGVLESSFTASLTVTADIGAVVTATCGDTSVEALSTTGKVVLELPIEGTWKVTAVRGMAQYNTVTLQVSSQYSAALTAEVHIAYFGQAESLDERRVYLTATATGGYVLFGGGQTGDTVGSSARAALESYDANLTHVVRTMLSSVRSVLAAAAVGNYALFGGGVPSISNVTSVVDAYSASLTRTPAEDLSQARGYLAAAAIGNYALFGGGGAGSYGSTPSSVVDAYTASLTHSVLAEGLALPNNYLAAASNTNHAIFGGGSNSPSNVTAYDASLTRKIPTGLSTARSRLAAARAGNYVLFAGGSTSNNSVVDAYDLFLTRTTPETLSAGRSDLAATTLKDYALFGSQWQIDIYDPYLTRTTVTVSSGTRSFPAAASVGDYALFGGGRSGTYAYADVAVYRHV